MLDSAAAKLREGRRLDSAAGDLPGVLEETTAAGVAWLLRERLETAGAERVEEMLPGLIEIVLGPYLGSAEALRLAVAEEGG